MENRGESDLVGRKGGREEETKRKRQRGREIQRGIGRKKWRERKERREWEGKKIERRSEIRG